MAPLDHGSGAGTSIDQQFRILVCWVALVFLIGGGSRSDVQSLVVLHPAAALIFAYGLATLSGAQARANWIILSFAGSVFLLASLQLVPLPPAIWQALPGRASIAQMDRLNDLEEVWRPLSLTPAATRNAVWSLIVPVSVLVLAVQLDRPRLYGLLPLILIIGGVSGLVGMLQLSSEPRGPLYFFQVTHNGSAVGLFANRNHQALLLAMLIPMVLAWNRLFRPGRSLAERWQWRAELALLVLVSALVLPLVLVTGSRLGMIAAIIALLACPLLIFGLGTGAVQAVSSLAGRRVPLLIAGVGITLIVLTAWLGRAVAFDRLLGTDPASEMRVRIIPTVVRMITEFWPWGSGIGSFSAVYQAYEPDALLNPTYMNQAHNDWLDVPLTSGLPGLALLLVALSGLLVAARYRASTRRNGNDGALMARLGLLILAVLGLGSISDYPLRVPSLACLAVIAVLWVSAKPPVSGRSDQDG